MDLGYLIVQRSQYMKRFFDITVAILAMICLLIPVLMIALAIKITSTGPVLYWSKRVGANNQLFNMPKFRSMKTGTPAVATHLLSDPKSVLTPIGDFLRKSSLDEIPQLWCILKGDMSIVGPRPALFNQHDLIKLRSETGVSSLVPGLTGWAQVNGRDELPIPEKIAFDVEYKNQQSFKFDLYIIILTFLKVIKRSGVSH